MCVWSRAVTNALPRPVAGCGCGRVDEHALQAARIDACPARDVRLQAALRHQHPAPDAPPGGQGAPPPAPDPGFEFQRCRVVGAPKSARMRKHTSLALATRGHNVTLALRSKLRSKLRSNTRFVAVLFARQKPHSSQILTMHSATPGARATAAHSRSGSRPLSPAQLLRP